MPDQWGRPTFDDGMGMVKGLYFMGAAEEQRKAQALKNESSAYAMWLDQKANAKEGEDLGPPPEVSNEAKFTGANLHWDSTIKKGLAESQKYIRAKEGMDLKIKNAQMVAAEVEQLRSQFFAFASTDNLEGMKEIALKVGNLVPNGYSIKAEGDGYKATSQATGESTEFKDMSKNEMLGYLGPFFNMSTEEMIQKSLTHAQWTQMQNYKLLEKGKPWQNTAGDVVFQIPAGTIDPETGDVRGEFFVDMMKNELTPKEVKGYKPMSILETQAKIDKPVSAGDIVTRKTKEGATEQGLVMRSGAYRPITGTGGGEITGTGDITKTKAAYALKVKQLETELMPFVKKGKAVIDLNTLDMTTEGTEALTIAMNLLQKNEADPETLTSMERRLLPHAERAVQMYQSLSETGVENYGLQTKGQVKATAKPSGKINWKQYLPPKQAVGSGITGGR